MDNIKFEIISGNNIEECRYLCNELMTFQKSKAKVHQELFDKMDFDTRMKKSFTNALRSQVIVAKDNNIPVGYVFSTIDNITIKDSTSYPAWAPVNDGDTGFYPDWVKLPQNIGCLNNLYLRSDYNGKGIGSQLYDRTMQWLGSFSDCKIAFVYVSNGNDNALKFYLNKGFIYSHKVFGGFIEAAYIQFEN